MKNKKILLFLFGLAFVVMASFPRVTYAQWWNPFDDDSPLNPVNVLDSTAGAIFDAVDFVVCTEQDIQAAFGIRRNGCNDAGSGSTASAPTNGTTACSAPIISLGATETFSSPGTHDFEVPSGVSSVMAMIYGGGGGGGGSDGNGDYHAGGGGGSGGCISQMYNVSPGQRLSITVGQGGLPASWTFNGNPICTAGTTNIKNGAGGSSSSVTGSSPSINAVATGGQGGGGSTGDNGDGFSGVGGTPGGSAGGIIDNNRNHYSQTVGGFNAAGYGSGGKSNVTDVPGAAACPTPGQNGAVILTWSGPPLAAINGQCDNSAGVFCFVGDRQNVNYVNNTWDCVGSNGGTPDHCVLTPSSICTPTRICSNEAANHPCGDSYSGIPNGCPGQSCSGIGTQNCPVGSSGGDFNWKEVAP